MLINFIIVFILYTFLDIAWCLFVKGVDNDNIKLAVGSSGILAGISLISGWLIYVHQDITSILGAILGAMCGTSLACTKFKGK